MITAPTCKLMCLVKSVVKKKRGFSSGVWFKGLKWCCLSLAEFVVGCWECGSDSSGFMAFDHGPTELSTRDWWSSETAIPSFVWRDLKQKSQWKKHVCGNPPEASHISFWNIISWFFKDVPHMGCDSSVSVHEVHTVTANKRMAQPNPLVPRAAKPKNPWVG